MSTATDHVTPRLPSCNTCSIHLHTSRQFDRTTWEAAIQSVARRFKAIMEQHGPDSIGVLVSAKISNEENYLAQKFARAVIGTNNVDHCARL